MSKVEANDRRVEDEVRKRLDDIGADDAVKVADDKHRHQSRHERPARGKVREHESGDAENERNHNNIWMNCKVSLISENAPTKVDICQSQIVLKPRNTDLSRIVCSTLVFGPLDFPSHSV